MDSIEEKKSLDQALYRALLYKVARGIQAKAEQKEKDTTAILVYKLD